MLAWRWYEGTYAGSAGGSAKLSLPMELEWMECDDVVCEGWSLVVDAASACSVLVAGAGDEGGKVEPVP